MSFEHTRGLGVSVAIYLVAMVCSLTLFVVPVLLANGSKTFDNPGLAAYDPPPGTLVIPQRARYALPLAFLKHDDIVETAMLAKVNANAKKAEKPRQLASRTGQRVRSERPPTDMRYAQPGNSGRSFFSLF
jgi:hypothetical protein